MIEKIKPRDRASWLAARNRDVTASVVAALFNEHPFITPFELWARKTGRIATDGTETPAMLRGRLLEPVAVQLLREQRPEWKIEHNAAENIYYRDPAARLGATPDVIVDAQRGINDFFKRLSALVNDNMAPAQNAGDTYVRRKAAEERARREREAEEARQREEQARIKAEKAKSADAAILATARANVEADRAERAEAAAGVGVAELVKTRVEGVTASARAEWVFRIEDYDAIDLNTLRPYLARPDVEKAIRSMVRIQKGSTKLAGVSVYEDVKSTFRR